MVNMDWCFGRETAEEARVRDRKEGILPARVIRDAVQGSNAAGLEKETEEWMRAGEKIEKAECRDKELGIQRIAELERVVSSR
jgi:hypothetical protein